MRKYLLWSLLLSAVILPHNISAQTKAKSDSTITVAIFEATDEGQGKELGNVNIEKSAYGLVFTPHLKGLTPGIHGFHVHSNPDCGPTKTGDKITPAGAAGGHFDPKNTGKHSTPWDDNGHLGDLPPLYVDEKGEANLPVLAPKIKDLSTIENRSIMIHLGGENFSDHPQPLGGGGARMACGVIK